MDKAALIVAGGKAPSDALLFDYIEKSDVIIGADKGGESLARKACRADALIGDFDSISPEKFEWFLKNDIEILKSNVEKDETDTMLAIDYAIKKEAKTIYILGGLGQRLDHQLANLALLRYAEKKGARAYLIDEHHEAFLAKKQEAIKTKIGGTISLFSVTKKAAFQSSEGLKYPLSGLILFRDIPIGVSNLATKNNVEFIVKRGKVLVITSF